MRRPKICLGLLFAVVMDRHAIAAPAERLDVLDFANGAFLIDDGGSYGSGVSDWAARAAPTRRDRRGRVEIVVVK